MEETTNLIISKNGKNMSVMICMLNGIWITLSVSSQGVN
jgi:hypothetical protein